jgi:uncharacterized protein with PIN domain
MNEEKRDGMRRQMNSLIIILTSFLSLTIGPQRCFICNVELSPLGGIEYFENNTYCSEHIREASAPKCAECQGPLLKQWVDVGDLGYHDECFKCRRCERSLSGIPYIGRAPDFYCRSCPKVGKK